MNNSKHSYAKKLHVKPLTVEFKNSILEHYQKSERKLFLIDYDSVLPDETIANQTFAAEFIHLIAKLSEIKNNSLCIISGQKKEKLNVLFGHLNMILVAEGGNTYKTPFSREWLQMSNTDLSWKNPIKLILLDMVKNHPGSFVEDKIYSLVWNYVHSSISIGKKTISGLHKKLEDLNTHSTFKILETEKNIEIRSMEMNKGLAAIKILKSNIFNFVLAVGNDETNEDMFEALKDPAYITIRIGNEKTKANYNLANIQDVISFLDELIL